MVLQVFSHMSRLGFDRDPVQRLSDPWGGPGAGFPAERRARIHGIDRLRACAILGVMWVHGFQTVDFHHYSTVMALSARLFEWIVPALFLASGWSRSRRTKYPRGTIVQWLRRIGIPYVVATLVLVLFDWVFGEQRVAWSQVGIDLLIGRGIYYFVPVLLAALVFSIPLARWPPLALASWLLMLPYAFLPAGLFDPFIWLLGGLSWRTLFGSPFHWWPFFLTGWVCGLYTPRLDGRRRTLVLGLALLIWVVSFSIVVGVIGYPTPRRWSNLGAVLQGVSIFATCITIVSWSGEPGGVIVRWLSEASYPLYLYHIMFVTLIDHLLHPGRDVALVGRMVAASILTIGLVVAVRAILGRKRARLLIG